ncbi:MAG: hypothetical protein J5968_02135 [Oscillospiraceae bacterium]|nr:hypothetical protein [Oscillospiraceae bacterium]MBP1557253.1 hypothetical protein [Oscillospiraceae bacterium]
MKSNNIIRIIAIALCMALAMTTVCFAAENKYAANAAGWILDGIAWLVIVAAVWKGGGALLSRNWVNGGFIIVAGAIIVLLCYDPTIFTRVGNTLKGIAGI